MRHSMLGKISLPWPLRFRGRARSSRARDQGSARSGACDRNRPPNLTCIRTLLHMRRRITWLLAMLGAAWLAPAALHQFRLGGLTLVTLLLALASILRSGSNVVDRLMLAGGLLAGGVLAAGLIFSLWPWRLDPVPVGGSLLSAIVIIGWATRRKPCLPRRFLCSDVLVLGSGLFAFLAAYAPVAHASASGRFSFSAQSHDQLVQFAIFDTIHRIGAYAFLHQAGIHGSIPSSAALSYPTGSHFLLVLIDIFSRSTTSPGSPVAEFNRYFIYMLAGFGFLVSAVVWAARWIAGPRAAGWRRALICSITAGLIIGSPLAYAIPGGFYSEIFGLAFLSMTVAVTVRPPDLPHEHILVAGALLIATAYAYSLFAVPLVLGLGLTLYLHRTSLRPCWRSYAITLAAAVIAFFPSILAVASGFDVKTQVLAQGGSFVEINVLAAAVLALICLIPLASSAWRRSAEFQSTAVYVYVTMLATLGVTDYETLHTGSHYYLEKLVTADYVVYLAGMGAGVVFLLGVRRRRDKGVSLDGTSVDAPESRTGVSKPREMALALVIVALSLALTSGLQWRATQGKIPVSWSSPLGHWSSGALTEAACPTVDALMKTDRLSNNAPSVVVCGDSWKSFLNTFIVAVINRDYPAMASPMNCILYPDRKIYTLAQAGPFSVATFLKNDLITSQGVQAIKEALRSSPARLRIIVDSAAAAQQLNKFLARHPLFHATVLAVPRMAGAND